MQTTRTSTHNRERDYSDLTGGIPIFLAAQSGCFILGTCPVTFLQQHPPDGETTAGE